MNAINCLNCNKIINYVNGPKLCKECDILLFDKIKKYLEENKESDIKKISDDTQIKMSIIKEYIKDNRIEELRKDICKCKLCGDIIEANGSYCLKCSKKIDLVNQLTNYKKEEIIPEGPRMHYLQNHEKLRKR